MACSTSSSLHDESIVNPFKRDHTKGYLGLREQFPLQVKGAPWSTTVYNEVSKVISFFFKLKRFWFQQIEGRIYLDKTEVSSCGNKHDRQLVETMTDYSIKQICD